MMTTKKILSCTSITRKNTMEKKNSSASPGSSPSMASYSVLVQSSRVELSYTDKNAVPVLTHIRTHGHTDTHMYGYMDTQTHTYEHMDTHTHTCVNTHTPQRRWMLGGRKVERQSDRTVCGMLFHIQHDSSVHTILFTGCSPLTCTRLCVQLAGNSGVTGRQRDKKHTHTYTLA